MEEIQERKLFLTGDIEEGNVNDIIQQLLTYEEIDNCCELPQETRQPVELFINTYGGSAYDCFALCDVILHMTTPVFTYAIGKVMSAGLPILVCGDYRFCFPSTTFMYHEIQSGAEGSIREMSKQMQECERLMELYDYFMINHSYLDLDILSDFLQEHNEYYFSPQKAEEYGIIDEILVK